MFGLVWFLVCESCVGVLALARDAVSSLALGRPGEEKYYQHLEASTQPG